MSSELFQVAERQLGDLVRTSVTSPEGEFLRITHSWKELSHAPERGRGATASP
ncbi:hypothetical protein OG948_33705 [Embleya sp. NBC_00888]|uniref:hypothetical protein n=1 Tax=Embleya sp. NBC_00888 TaxID=2975960 RepID=UPI0038640D48|nr:hypothetical protein OG948_33705 [Embleya sp. NBC_00888]